MKLLRAIYWRAYILHLAVRWIPRLNLGDRVLYRGRHWTLYQGVKSPLWSLVDGDNTVEANESDFQKVRTLRNDWRSFRSGWRFYRGYWYDIWMREGIKPWMAGTNIWAGKPPLPKEDTDAIS